MACKREYHLSSRLKRILQIIKDFRRIVTAREVVAKAGLTPIGISQSLNALKDRGYIQLLGGEGGDKRWRIIKK